MIIAQDDSGSVRTLWNRDLPPNINIALQVRWPLWLIPLAFVNQLLAPHPVWLVLLVTLLGVYGIGYLWARAQAIDIYLERKREGELVVAGDLLQERFVLQNSSSLPLLWAELHDQSDLPDYRLGRVVACVAHGSYTWQVKQTCGRRGLYTLGPSQLNWSDPFGFFSIKKTFEQVETILIYPRVAHLPDFEFAHGSANGSHRQRRPLLGNIRSTSVREYQSGDSLRHIHWPSTAHRNRLMVTELDTEPGGEVWIVLDLNRAIHRGQGEASTLEYGIVVAASLASQLLNSHERQAVGLITAALGIEIDDGPRVKAIPPQIGQAQLWSIMAVLASAETVDLSLSALLESSRHLLGRRRTLIVITPLAGLSNIGAYVDEIAPDAQAADAMLLDQAYGWIANLVHVREQASSSVLLVAPQVQSQDFDVSVDPNLDSGVEEDEVRKMLARYHIPSKVLYTTDQLRTLLTYRRTRQVIRSTPLGGVVTVEIEEEVG